MIYRSVFGVPSWRFRGPFDELDRMKRQMDRVLDAFSDRPSGQLSAGVFPLVNLSEDQEKYTIRAELPGVKKDDLDIQVASNSLSISGERRIAAEGDGVKYHRREREGGTFSRMLSLPGDIDSERVEADLKNGILTVRIPKAEAAKPKKISIRQS